MKHLSLKSGLPDDHMCEMVLHLSDSTSINLNFPNRFTAETAFNFLHMLKHLDGCTIDWVVMGADTPLFLPFLTGTPFTIYCRSFSCLVRVQRHFPRIFEVRHISLPLL